MVHVMEHPKSSFFNYWNKLSSINKTPNMLRVVATGAYYPKLEFENHRNRYFSWLLRSEHVKTNIFGNRMTKLTI